MVQLKETDNFSTARPIVLRYLHLSRLLVVRYGSNGCHPADGSGATGRLPRRRSGENSHRRRQARGAIHALHFAYLVQNLRRELREKISFVRATQWRNDSKNIIRKVLEENKSGRAIADIVETTADGMGVLKREGLFQEYYSPEARFYPNELKPRGKTGFFYLPNRETYNSLGFNTQLIPPAVAPRNLKDLLDPKWKGKMAITSTTTGARWIGNVLETLGREFLNKLADQEMSVQDMAPASLINLVVSGEIPLSPTIFDANVTLAKQKGAPVDWRPLEPVVTTVGSAALLAKAANPHTALLFIDFLLSKEGQQLIMKGGLWSPREDLGSLEQKFTKNYLDEKYSSEEMEAKIGQWEGLLRQLFIRKR